VRGCQNGGENNFIFLLVFLLTESKGGRIVSPVAESNANNMNTTTTYSVLFPIWKGSKTYRQIGITENPAANYRPGATLRFVDINTNDSFILTGGGLVKITE
jgi:hypothetical protein